jgi:2-haloalkanoic acid dehalogenase type II
MPAVLFDLYETLVAMPWTSLNEHLTRRLAVSSAALSSAFERTRPQRATGQYGSVEGDWSAIAAACSGQLTASQRQALARDIAAVLSSEATFYPDALPVLRALRTSGARIAVISNCDHTTRAVVQALALEREVDALLLSCELGCMKPDPAIFRHALRQLGARPDQALFVDDHAGYLDGAAALGIRTLHIVRDAEYRATLSAGRHPVIAELGALMRDSSLR